MPHRRALLLLPAARGDHGRVRVTIVDPDPHWSEEVEGLADELSVVVGSDASRIDHIGSTSVPGLPAKDVIDIQITVADETALRS